MKGGIIHMDVEGGLIWLEIHLTIKFILYIKLEKNLKNKNVKQL